MQWQPPRSTQFSEASNRLDSHPQAHPTPKDWLKSRWGKRVLLATALVLFTHYLTLGEASWNLNFAQTSAKPFAFEMRNIQIQAAAPQPKIEEKKAPPPPLPKPKPAPTQPPPEPVVPASPEVDIPPPLSAAESQPPESVVQTRPITDFTQSDATMDDLQMPVGITTEMTTTTTENSLNSSQIPLEVVLPSPMKLDFDVIGEASKTPYKGGKATLSTQYDANGKYSIQLEAKMAFFTLLKWGSTGHISSNGFNTERFSDKRRNKAEKAAHIPLNEHLAIFSDNSPKIVLTDEQKNKGVRDRLSVTLQLSGLLSAKRDQLHTPGTTLTLPVLSASSLENWHFVVQGEEKISALLQENIRSLKITRAARKDNDQTIELWYAIDKDYLPLRMKFIDPDGDFFEVTLRNVENNTPAPI